MANTPTIYRIAALIIALYGLLCLVGGIIGYVKATSIASLATGGVAGVLLVVCAAGLFDYPDYSTPSLLGAIVVSVFIGSFFGHKLLANASKLAEFMSSSAGPRTLALTIGALLVIIIAAIALAARPGPPPS
jgi:uncharacterized membrane protein (UPF0136 family)